MAPSKQILLSYQKRWVEDKSQLKIWLKARQIGFSFAASYRAVADCVRRKTLWIVLSAGQRQSIELAHKAKEHVEAIARVEQAARGSEFVEKEFWGSVDGVEITQSVIHLPSNKARLIFLPANPDTARGYTGNVLADEFAFHRDAKKIYSAIYPSITRGFSIEIGSTPFGESGVFYELMEKPNGFSKHKTTIYEAVEQGLQADIKLLREGCSDDDIWEQEYNCKFVSDATSYISWELIQRAESVDATVDLPPYFIPVGELYLGADIGRRKDLTTVLLLEKIGSVYWVRALVRMRGVPFKIQRAKIEAFMDMLPIRRLCQDASGLGMQMAEELTEKYGGGRVEGIAFTMQVKEDLAVRTRRVFEESNICTPIDQNFRGSVHSVRRIPTAAGHFRFDAERTEAGHADEFWALALALMAADSGVAAAMSSSNTQVGGREPQFGRDEILVGGSYDRADAIQRDRRSRWL